MKVLLTDQVFPSVEIERILLSEAGHELVIATSEKEARQHLVDADAVLTTYHPLPADVLATMRRAKIIARYGIGVDNIDLAAAESRGITVTNVPDYCVEEVAEHAVAMALTIHRRLQDADAAARRGDWGVSSVRPIHRLSTLTAGFLGYGRIGRKVAATMATFGCRIIAHDPYAPQLPASVTAVSLDELLAQSDLLFLHAPLTPDTRGIIDADAITRMRPKAIVINVARGPLVVLEDLLAALRDRRLGGAGLDTFPVEPVDSELLTDIPNLLVSPHAAYYSEEALKESQRKALGQVIKVLAGQKADYALAGS
ncbi:C-terminal binding protein [Arthrobacter liuii]|uniref:D-isomer specific 2-hydroxyacid dehydrogenase family protein n=1 Tax=Arthrobacter liuii TaxID=1476996 RepID=A0ABQ2B1S3_9MICC|nr:C-terminal binding protein [Arthrobacter liuii]GGI01481.1 D-isomer specific 2-hydroxyacid dehydrogenase family protein [Arthrobacter liuii]